MNKKKKKKLQMKKGVKASEPVRNIREARKL
jgi:hypothetical protein